MWDVLNLANTHTHTFLGFVDVQVPRTWGVGQPDRISFKPCMEFVNLHIQDMTTLYHMFWDGHHPYGFQIIYFMYSKEAQERVAR